MIEYKDGNLYVDGDRITSFYGKKITQCYLRQEGIFTDAYYHFIFDDGEEKYISKEELYENAYMMGVNESRPRGHSHDAGGPSASVWKLDMDKYEEQEPKVPKLFSSGDVEVLNLECARILCEWCGQTNSFEEGCCNFCGGRYPSEKERDIPSLAGVVSVDGEISDEGRAIIHARASAEANWGAIAKLTNWRT